MKIQEKEMLDSIFGDNDVVTEKQATTHYEKDIMSKKININYKKLADDLKGKGEKGKNFSLFLSKTRMMKLERIRERMELSDDVKLQQIIFKIIDNIEV